MFEKRIQPLQPRHHFLKRVARHFCLALALILGALGLGTFGYHYLEGLPWIDAELNASMILAGMGPVAELRTTAGKLFASFYALFSGVAFLAIAGVLLAPVYHRFLHQFHLEIEEADAPWKPAARTAKSR